MKRILLRIAYDGTNYCGWQVQPNGLSVSEVVNKKLSELLKTNIQVIGASRTDAGVHALGNVAVFDTTSSIPPEKFSYALNRLLPDDIVIQESREVELSFHPRYCNTVKTYQYTIQNSTFLVPSKRLYSHFVHYPLNVERMNEAAKYLIGEHDFKNFSSFKTQVVDTVRIIYDLLVEQEGDMIKITVTGNGFLYNLIRIIAGTLIKVGLLAYPPIHVKEVLEKVDRTIAGPNAPACGLTLIKIDYPDLNQFIGEK